jgi:hypothetical protein
MTRRGTQQHAAAASKTSGILVGGVLLGEGVEVVETVAAVGPATGALTAKVQLT